MEARGFAEELAAELAEELAEARGEASEERVENLGSVDVEFLAGRALERE